MYQLIKEALQPVEIAQGIINKVSISTIALGKMNIQLMHPETVP